MFCNWPFINLYAGLHWYTTCCYGWFSNPEEWTVRGKFDNMWDVWNHEKFQKLRMQWMVNPSEVPKSCVPCGKRFENGLNDDALLGWDGIMPKGPRSISFVNDLSCNLHCWTCRAKTIQEKALAPQIHKQTFNLLDTFKKDLRHIETISSGDPFASIAWRKILFEFPISEFHKDFIVTIFTNGLLLPRYWNSISHLHDNINIKMSIDAVTKEIYEKTRLGGKWEDMMYALNFIEETGKRITLGMTVTAENFTDIPAYLEKGLSMGNSFLNLHMLDYWPQMRGGWDKFHANNLNREDHPLREKFLEVLRSCEDLLNNPRVFSKRILPENSSSTNSKYKK